MLEPTALARSCAAPASSPRKPISIRPESSAADATSLVVSVEELQAVTAGTETDAPTASNPVGSVTEALRAGFAEFEDLDLPEVVNFTEAQQGIGKDALYIDATMKHAYFSVGRRNAVTLIVTTSHELGEGKPAVRRRPVGRRGKSARAS